MEDSDPKNIQVDGGSAVLDFAAGLERFFRVDQYSHGAVVREL